MRVLVIVGALPKPGSFVHAPVKREIDFLQALGVEIDVCNLGEHKTGFIKYPFGILNMRRALQSKPYDLIHAYYGYCGWVARSQVGTPVVVSFLGSDLLGVIGRNGRYSAFSRLVVQINRWVSRVVDAVIVQSPEMARIVAPVNAHIISHGVNLQTFCPMESFKARATLGWRDDRDYVLFAGCPDNWVKGFSLAQMAMSHMPHMSKPVELVPLCGVQPEQVPIYMNASDVLLLTSFHEGSPNVVKEAMACNLPVVSVPVGDVSELLAGVENCAICSRDPQALALGLEGVLNRRRRSNGRAILERKKLDRESVAWKIKDIYEAAVAQERGSHVGIFS